MMLRMSTLTYVQYDIFHFEKRTGGSTQLSIGKRRYINKEQWILNYWSLDGWRMHSMGHSLAHAGPNAFKTHYYIHFCENNHQQRP